MTDLRKAAQDVVDEAFYLGQDSNAVHELREALQAVPEPEPVAWIYEGEPSFDGKNWHVNYQLTTSKNVAMFKSGTIKKPTSLYTTPPSIDALIAEIQRLESELAKAKEYVPMTDDDFDLATGYKTSVDCRVITQNQADVMLTEYREVEAAFIKRAGLRIKEKE